MTTPIQTESQEQYTELYTTGDSLAVLEAIGNDHYDLIVSNIGLDEGAKIQGVLGYNPSVCIMGKMDKKRRGSLVEKLYRADLSVTAVDKDKKVIERHIRKGRADPPTERIVDNIRRFI